MKALTKYLLDKGALKNDTLYWITKHQKWCKNYGTTPQTIKRNEVIVYMEHLAMHYQNKEKVNTIIAEIKWYYEYLMQREEIKRNPFNYTQIESDKNRIFKQITSLLDIPDRYKKPP